jgi:hypothetical protein
MAWRGHSGSKLKEMAAAKDALPRVQSFLPNFALAAVINHCLNTVK